MKTATIKTKYYGTEAVYEVQIPYYIKEGETDKFYTLIFCTLKEAMAALLGAHVATYCILGHEKSE
jgi:hypothetical protein